MRKKLFGFLLAVVNRYLITSMINMHCCSPRWCFGLESKKDTVCDCYTCVDFVWDHRTPKIRRARVKMWVRVANLLVRRLQLI